MHNQHDEKMLNYLKEQTSSEYEFATFDERKWGAENSKSELGAFYQLVPRLSDDGFFDWYNYKHCFNQRFRDKTDCAYIFINFYKWWIEDGKPSFDDEFKKSNNQ